MRVKQTKRGKITLGKKQVDLAQYDEYDPNQDPHLRKYIQRKNVIRRYGGVPQNREWYIGVGKASRPQPQYYDQ